MAYNAVSGTLIAAQNYIPGTLVVANVVSGNLSTSDGASVINVPRVSNATNNSILTNVGGDANTLTCESNLKFDGSVLSITGELSSSLGVSASFFYGDGSQLTGIAAAGVSGSARHYSKTGFETSGYLKVSGSSTLGAVSGSGTLQTVGATILGSTLTVSGNVGIGTDSPAKKLEVKAGSSGDGINLIAHDNSFAYVQLEAGSAGGYVQVHDSSNNQKVRLDAAGNSWFDGGNVGIGVTNPAKTLEVKAGSSGNGINLIAHDNSVAYIQLEAGSGGGYIQVHDSSNNQKVRLDSTSNSWINGGNVGIGTTAPTDTLTVVGSISGSSTLSVVGSISSSGDIAITGAMHATTYYGDGSNLTGISGVGGGGIFTTLNATKAYTTSSINIGSDSTPTHTFAVAGSSFMSGGIAYKRKEISSTYTASTTDYYLGINSTNGAVEIRLPDAAGCSDGQTYVIKDEGGNANTNNITVLASGAQTIDGVNSIVLESPYAALQLYCNGTNKYFVY
mgnify:CR=1 FL=1